MGTNGADLPVKLDAKPDGTHRCHVDFVNDHDISGMKVDVFDVTPEQIFVAIGYLTRIANHIVDAKAIQAQMAADEIADVRAALSKGR